MTSPITPLPSIHTVPARLTGHNPFLDQLRTLFAAFPNLVLQEVVAVIKELTGVDLSSIFNGIDITQPGAVLTAIGNVLSAAFALFVDVLTLNWAAIPGDLAALTGLGVNAAPVSSALSKTVTSTPAVTHDASSHGEVHTGSPTSLTVPHTTSTAANPAMTAYVAIGPLAAQAYAQGFVTVTYNGVELQSQGGVNSGHGTDGWLELFTLKGPASGLNNLVVTTSSPVHSIAVNTDTYVACSGFSGLTSNATDAQTQSLAVRGGTGGIVVVGMASAAPIAGITGTQRSLQNVDTATTAGNLIVGDAPGADSVTVTATQ